MVAVKEFLKTFEEGATLDLKSSGLLGSEGAVFRAIDNYVLENSFNLRGRRGVQLIGQHGGFIATHRYTYLDRVTGESKHEDIAINDHVWVLVTEGVQIEKQTGSAEFDYECLPHTDENYYFRIYTYPAGVKTLHYEKNLGTGLEATPYTIWELKQHILANSDYQLVHEFAANRILDGALTTGASTVLSATSDIKDREKYSNGRTLPFFNNGTLDYTAVRLVSTPITTITLSSPNDTLDPLVRFPTGIVIGPGATPAASIPIKLAATTTTNVDPIVFPVSYWDKKLGFGHELSTPIAGSLTLGRRQMENYGPFIVPFEQRNRTGWKPPTFVNHNDVCYIFFSNDIKINRSVFDFAAGSATEDEIEPLADYHIYKYDGHACYREGLPKPGILELSPTTSGPLTGVYKYKIVRQHIDAKGNITLSDPSEEASITLSSESGRFLFYDIHEPADAIKTVTVGTSGPWSAVAEVVLAEMLDIKAGDWVRIRRANSANFGEITVFVRAVNLSTNKIIIDPNMPLLTGLGPSLTGVTIPAGSTVFARPHHGFRTALDGVPFTAANATSLAVGRAAPYVVGDTVLIRRGAAVETVPVTGDYAGKSLRRTITGFTGGEISWGNQTAINGETSGVAGVSANTSVKIYRTRPGGQLFYFVCEVPDVKLDTDLGNVILDNLPDDQLGELLEEPDFGESRGLPPKAAIGCTHQGVLVASGIRKEPNSVEFSSLTQGPGAFSRESNQFDVPSTTGGAITVVASDRDERLAVCKQQAYFDIAGSLPRINFTVRAVKEGDYGIFSQGSIQKVDGTIIGVGSHGFVAIENGRLIPIAEEISAEIFNNQNINISRARSVLNFKERQYQCFIPGYLAGSGGFEARDRSHDKCFIFDYSIPGQGAWRSYAYAEGVDAFGGWSMGQTIPFHCHPAFLEDYTPTEDNRGMVFREIPLKYVEGGIGTGLPENREPQLFFADHNQPISYRLRSQWITLTEPNLPKTFQRMVLHSLYRAVESSKFVPWSLTINFYRNFQEAVAFASYDVEFSLVTDFQKVVPLKAVQANAIQFEIVVNELFTAPHLSGYTIVACPPYRKEDVKR